MSSKEERWLNIGTLETDCQSVTRADKCFISQTKHYYAVQAFLEPETCWL